MKKYTPGTILLYERNGFRPICHLIRLITGNKHVHVAIVVENTINGSLVAEIDTDTRGVLISYFEDRIFHSIPLSIYSENENLDSDAMLKFAYNLLDNSSYDYPLILELAFNHFIGLFNKNHKYKRYFSKQKPNRYICSTFVSKMLEIANPTKFKFNEMAEPDDFDRYPGQ